MSMDFHSRGASFKRLLSSDMQEMVVTLLNSVTAAVGVQKDGTVASDQHRVMNFTGPGVTVSDDPTNRRTNIFVPGAPTSSAASTFISSAGNEKVFVLGSAPANWQTTGFDDSAWGASIQETTSNSAFYQVVPGTQWIVPSSLNGDQGATTVHFLARRSFTLPSGTITSATLQMNIDDVLTSTIASLDDLFINGNRLVFPYSARSGSPLSYVTISIPVGYLTAGGVNVLAVGVESSGGVVALTYQISVNQAGSAVDARYVPIADYTAKGDLLVATAASTPAALAVGTDGKVLTADSTAADGVSWQTPPGAGTMSNPMTTLDDIIVGGTAGAPARLAKGSDGQVLTVDPSTHHLVWATPSSSTLTSASSVLGANVTLGSAGAYSDGPSVSLAAGTWLVTTTLTMRNTSAGPTIFDIKLWNGTTLYASTGSIAASGSQDYSYTCSAIITLGSTTTVKVSAAAANNTAGRISAACNDNGTPGSASQINAIKIA